ADDRHCDHQLDEGYPAYTRGPHCITTCSYCHSAPPSPLVCLIPSNSSAFSSEASNQPVRCKPQRLPLSILNAWVPTIPERVLLHAFSKLLFEASSVLSKICGRGGIPTVFSSTNL